MSPVIEKCIGLYEQMSQMTKLTKVVKKQIIRESLKTRTFDRDQLRITMGTSDRAIRRYLNEIAQEDAEQNPETIHVLRNLCTLNLINKAANNKLSNKDQLTIVLAGETIKTENLTISKNQTEVKVNVTSDLLKQYENLFEEAALLEHCAPQPVHPAQTNK
jgi:hypothetical protein